MRDVTGERGPAVHDVLVVTGGHPFEPEPFFALFDALDGIEWTGATTPTTGHDVVVFYDMPGFTFTGDADDPVHLTEPSPAQQETIEELIAAGTGLVFLHHAIAGWPTWHAYGDLIGGRFLYQPGRFQDRDLPDSGYLLDVEHTVEVVAPDHPVCAGVDPTFTLTDELYCYPVDDSVAPLLRTTHPATADHFFSPDLAIRGRMHDRTGWTHPTGSDLVGWAKTAGASRVVYLQPGDGPAAYADPNYRRLVTNAIAWTATSHHPS